MTDRIRSWLTAPLSPEVKTAILKVDRAEDVERIAIMPDVHLAAGVCVGTVIGTNRLVYPQAVGSDIGCGMSAIAFDGDAAAIDREPVAPSILAALPEAVPIMRHRSVAAAPPLIEGELSCGKLASVARREGRIELGTLGRGNHFLEFQSDGDGRLWLVVHSGSRIMGQEITRHHLARATRSRGGLSFLDTHDDPGKAYLNDMNWAIRFAAASRTKMLERAAAVVERLTGATADFAAGVDCCHNFARFESSNANLLIHRKGANCAAESERGIIPGSMGTATFHVRGRGVAESLCSSSHGAGRSQSRGSAAKLSQREFNAQVGHVWMDRSRTSSLVDEAPSAYKDIRSVMRAQRDLVRIERELRPILNYKGA